MRARRPAAIPHASAAIIGASGSDAAGLAASTSTRWSAIACPYNCRNIRTAVAHHGRPGRDRIGWQGRWTRPQCPRREAAGAIRTATNLHGVGGVRSWSGEASTPPDLHERPHARRSCASATEHRAQDSDRRRSQPPLTRRASQRRSNGGRRHARHGRARSPARVTVTSRRTAALDGRLLTAASACRQ